VNEVADYVEQVRAALADLPSAARDELLEDLPEHLAEVAAEGEGSLAERLGPPAAYAAELRAAAGAPTGRGGSPSAEVRLRDAVVKARARLRVVDAKSGPLVGYEKASDFLRLLRPAWWVVRGYLVAMAIAYLLREDDIGLLPRFEIGDRTFSGVLALIGFVLASIWLGRRGSRLPRVPRVVLGIGTALLILPAVISLLEADEYAQQDRYQEASQVYSNVESVYVYDEQGRPLVHARAFDQYGNPIQSGLWGCPNESGGMTMDIFPQCANPQPLTWDRPLRLEVNPGGAQPPTPEPSTTPAPTPTATATPTPTPSATG
jgi:hypothetical protein